MSPNNSPLRNKIVEFALKGTAVSPDGIFSRQKYAKARCFKRDRIRKGYLTPKIMINVLNMIRTQYVC